MVSGAAKVRCMTYGDLLYCAEGLHSDGAPKPVCEITGKHITRS